tara:strand:- start:418 stop:2724 length:2307 start_codon:yes stop_codon:yes gene_type:complete
MKLSKNYYLGLFFIALSTIMLEILLTRIFSVVMWYHFAFLAISIAMFGLTLGAIIVYLLPNFFQKVKTRTTQAALVFSFTTVISLLIYISLPIQINIRTIQIGFLTFSYLLFSIPFIFSGITICLALTKFPKLSGKLYAADLIGAGVGAIAVIYMLSLTSGPVAVIIVAAFAALGAFFFAKANNKTSYLAIGFCALAIILAAANPSFSNYKGAEHDPTYEAWNTYAHIIAEDIEETTFMWCGTTNASIPHIKLQIEGYGHTPIVNFDENLSKQEYLKSDVINLAHHLRNNADVLIIGSGGGRDLLSAMVFNQSSVTGIELNKDINFALTNEFADFAGNIHKNPKIAIIQDEGRSYLAANKKNYDLIQLINVHTWAATTAGAYTLTENSLYTIEAWDLFIDSTTDKGIITLTMWYIPQNPGEVYRMVNLASRALRKKGIENPKQHIIVSRCLGPSQDLAAMLVSRQPFSKKDIAKAEQISEELGFSIELSPKITNTTLGDIAKGKQIRAKAGQFTLNLEPPTDNKPYFFNLFKFSDITKWNPFEQQRRLLEFNLEAVFVLIVVFGVVFLLTLACIILPLVRKTKKGSPTSVLFFLSIGFGFMVIEIAQIQRLILFLGHPTYSLSVVLFSLLVAGGIGSYLTRRIPSRSYKALQLLIALIGILAVIGIATPFLITRFQGYPIGTRILASLLIMIPLGVFMGMAFPLGLRLHKKHSTELPWYWGINGAASILASILAVIIAMTAGISRAYWTGVLFYVIAVLCYAFKRKKL